MENSEQLIERMKSLNIQPKPAWHFSLKTAFYWFLFLVSVLFGAFAFAIVLFTIQQIDFDLISHMSHSKLEFLMGLAPFFWIVCLIVFLVIAMIGIRNSKKGYKFSYSKIVMFSASFSILVGTISFIGGGGEWLENAFSVRMGLSESVQAKKIKIWSAPENGYLSGTIMEVGDKSIQLADFNEQLWILDIEHANIPLVVIISEGERIKIIGEIISTNNFRADEIRPWGGLGPGKQGLRKKDQKTK